MLNRHKSRSELGGIFGLDINIQELNIQSSFLSVLILLLLLAVCCLIYYSRSSIGFYLRKKIAFRLLAKSLAEYKTSASILFIDDQDVQIAAMFKDEGWNVSKARDVQVDDKRIKEANIIFVDWKGVGRRISEEEEGISLVANIKRKYGSKKYVILYSAQEFTKPENIRADAWLNKGSQSSLYIEAVQNASFTLFG